MELFPKISVCGFSPLVSASTVARVASPCIDFLYGSTQTTSVYDSNLLPETFQALLNTGDFIYADTPYSMGAGIGEASNRPKPHLTKMKLFRPCNEITMSPLNETF